MEFFFNTCCLFAVFIGLFAGVRFWSGYKETGISQFKNFSLSFFFISLVFLMLSLPSLVLFDPFWVQIAFILADLFIFTAELFLIPAVLSFVKSFKNIQEIIPRLIFSMIVIYIFLNIFFFAPAVSLCDGELCYWKNGVFLLHSLVFIPLASGVGVIGAWFLLWARKIKEKKIFWRSTAFGLTGISIFIAGILFWYFKFFNPSSEILIISGIILDFGFLSGAIGSLLYQSYREEFIEKIN